MALTAGEWETLGAFALLILGLGLVNHSLAVFVGVSAIGVILLRGFVIK